MDAFYDYITYERKAYNPDINVMSTVYERAIAEAARRRFNGEPGAEDALRMFWTGYLDVLVRTIHILIHRFIII
jgi:squamous cell carcinoma antigen recognized by T-cells 3